MIFIQLVCLLFPHQGTGIENHEHVPSQILRDPTWYILSESFENQAVIVV